MEYEIIATGSKGNAVVINGHILIDCGVSFLKIRPVMRNLDLVLLTHIHSDHFNPATVRTLHRNRPALRFGCCEWMVGPLVNAGVDTNSIDVYECDDLPYIYGKRFSVRPVRLTHNVPNCGYVVVENSETLFYATDTGSLDGISLPNLDIYLIEGNHTEAEIEAAIAAKLEAGEFSWEARAARDHLSKEKALAWLAKNMGPKSRYRFMHEHINREAMPVCRTES